jgi:hypothetical protein
MCDECGGTGMFDVLSSIPCVCRMKKNIQKTLNRILRLKEKAILQQRWDDVHDLREIQKKLENKLKN